MKKNKHCADITTFAKNQMPEKGEQFRGKEKHRLIHQSDSSRISTD